MAQKVANFITPGRICHLSSLPLFVTRKIWIKLAVVIKTLVRTNQNHSTDADSVLLQCGSPKLLW